MWRRWAPAVRERHRAANPLELFFDLVVVVAIGAVADELAHCLAEGHIASAILSFAFMVFAVSWPWINHSWFAGVRHRRLVRIATMCRWSAC